MGFIILVFLAFIAQNHGYLSDDPDCACPVSGGSIPYPSPKDDGYEEDYGRYEKYTPDYAHDSPKGICTSTGHRMANKCWLKFYNDKFDNDANIIPDINCPSNDYYCTCAPNGACEPLYNPVCVIDAKNGYTKTLQNTCELACEECNPDIQFLHCGPCETACADLVPRVDCLSGPPSCTADPYLDNSIQYGDCNCTTAHYDPVCAIDVVTKDLYTFSNNCEFECAPGVSDLTVQKLYNVGGGACDCDYYSYYAN